MRDLFRQWAARIATAAGSAWAFGIALLVVLAWTLSGPIFHYSDTWQLVINTGTTIITFLMVFLIQNAQNREAIALQIKLDELLRCVKGARTGLINIEQLSDDDLENLRKYFQALGDEKECRTMASELAEPVTAGGTADIAAGPGSRAAAPGSANEGRKVRP